MTDTLLIDRDEVLANLTYPEVLQVVEDVYAAHGRDQVSMPPKISLDLSASGEPNWSNAMPAYIPLLNAAGIKWAGGYLHNPARRGLDYVQSLIVLTDPITGLPLAVMDGGAITNLRTGAAAAVAARWLASTESGVIVMFGAGAQARSTARSVQEWCPWAREFRVVDIRRDAARAFVEEMRPQLTLRVSAAEDPAQAVSEADVIVTATTANEPLVYKAWVRPGALVVTLGSYQELDPELVLSADLLVVDDREQCLHRGELVPLLEAGRLQPDDVDAEIGEIVAGVEPGRRAASDVIVADLIGLGSIDIACARRVYERVSRNGRSPNFSFY